MPIQEKASWQQETQTDDAKSLLPKKISLHACEGSLEALLIHRWEREVPWHQQRLVLLECNS